MATKNTGMDESIIIFGFPGVGKSYAFEHQEELGLELQDSDSSHFHWLYKDDEFKEPVLDENGKKVVHPAWPANYAQYIELTGREQEVNPDFIFVSTHEEVMKAILSLGFISFCIYPDINMKDKFMQLYKDRGNDERFLKLMDEKWEEFVKGTEKRAMSADKCISFPIREGGKIQNVYDLLKRKPKIPMEFFGEE